RPRLGAVGEVRPQPLDLPPDEGGLVGAGAPPDPAPQAAPVPRGARRALGGGRLRDAAVAQHLELDEPIDLPGREGGLVELDAVLLDAVGPDADHGHARPTLAEGWGGVNGTDTARGGAGGGCRRALTGARSDPNMAPESRHC